MDNTLQFDFLVDKEKNSITIMRAFAADLNLVWDAWTKSELLDLWWAPKPWQSKTKHMHFEEGGQRLYAMCGPNGEEHWGITFFTSIDPLKYYTGSDCFCDAEGVVNEEFPKSTFNISFSEKGTQTLVTNKTIYPNLEQLEATLQMGLKEGISMAMEGLDAVLSKLKTRK